MKRSRAQAGFSLIELLVVITLIAIVASLAVLRLSDVGTKSADTLNMANLARLGPAMETFMVSNSDGLNRLDLVVMGRKGGTQGEVSESIDELMIFDNYGKNVGLSPYLYQTSAESGVQGFTMTGPPLLTQYYLEQEDVDALRELGLTYLMRYNDVGHFGAGDDQEWATGASDDPDTCCSLSTVIEPGLAVPFVNPQAVTGSGSSLTPAGALVYQACGQDVRFAFDPPRYLPKINGNSYEGATSKELLDVLKNDGGMLLAFGIGQYSSMIGNANGGLDSAPICPAVKSDIYRRYFLLLRLSKEGGVVRASFAGIMDPAGRTMKQLRRASK